MQTIKEIAANKLTQKQFLEMRKEFEKEFSIKERNYRYLLKKTPEQVNNAKYLKFFAKKLECDILNQPTPNP